MGGGGGRLMVVEVGSGWWSRRRTHHLADDAAAAGVVGTVFHYFSLRLELGHCGVHHRLLGGGSSSLLEGCCRGRPVRSHRGNGLHAPSGGRHVWLHHAIPCRRTESLVTFNEPPTKRSTHHRWPAVVDWQRRTRTGRSRSLVACTVPASAGSHPVTTTKKNH